MDRSNLVSLTLQFVCSDGPQVPNRPTTLQLRRARRSKVAVWLRGTFLVAMKNPIAETLRRSLHSFHDVTLIPRLRCSPPVSYALKWVVFRSLIADDYGILICRRNRMWRKKGKKEQTDSAQTYLAQPQLVSSIGHVILIMQPLDCCWFDTYGLNYSQNLGHYHRANEYLSAFWWP